MNKNGSNKIKKHPKTSDLGVGVYNTKGKDTGFENLKDINKKSYEIAILGELRKLELSKIETKGAKTRSDRRGGGRKPWRQKGTGRARVGSNRSPLWRKGGVIHGPKQKKNYYKKTNKKANSLARNWLMSQKAKSNELYILDVDNKDFPQKTKELEAILIQLPLKDGAVIFLHHFKNNPVSAKNIPYLKSKRIEQFNLRDVILHQNMIITKKAFSKIISLNRTK